MREIMITSSVLIVALILLRRLWRNKISRRLQYALWLLVALRLLIPVTVFENPFNVMNVLESVSEGKNGVMFCQDDRAGNGKVVYSGSQAREEETDSPVADGGAFVTEPHGGIDAESRGGEETGEREEAAAENQMEGLGLREQEQILEGRPTRGGFIGKDFWRYVWYAGMGVMGLWMTGCNLAFRHRIAKSRILLGKESGLEVYQAQVGTPCLLGILKPAIYLTRDSVRRQRHRDHAILHELTHYRHGDHVWAIVRSLCLVIYWFDPLVWLAVYLSARDCEMACDEGVTRSLGEEHSRDYGRTLIEMAASYGRGPGLLRWDTGFSVRKREMKERISRIVAGKKRTGILVVLLVSLCGTALAACTFGGPKKEVEMGRYVETAMEIPGEGMEYLGLAQEGGDIRLISGAGIDALWPDSEEGFSALDSEDMPAGAVSLHRRSPYRLAGSASGARAYAEYAGSGEEGFMKNFVLTDAGQTIGLESLDGHYVKYFYSDGWFYLFDWIREKEKGMYYRVDPATGEMELLLESPYDAYDIVSDGKWLYLAGSSGVQIFDLEKGALAPEQDQVLSDFVAGKFIYSETAPFLLYPYQDGVYLLTHQGMYWHALYSETVEMVIDGGYCSMGTAGKSFTGLALLETEGEPEFLVLYDGREMMRYSYDAAIPTAPDALRVYSVYEDSQVSKAVSAFRVQHPDMPVVYEVGMNAHYGATVDDVLKNLATEIAAGNGPDILVMDDIPFDSYVEKGALMSLSDLREGMTEENYFVNVIDAFSRNEKLYAIPMTFAVPVLGGAPDLLEGVESLSDLADLLERERGKSQADYVFCTWDAESTLRLLAQSSQGAWIQDGTLDRDAVEEFLTQAKRIYDVQFSVREEPASYGPEGLMFSHYLITPDIWIGDYSQYPLARRFDSDGLYCMLDKAKWKMEGASLYAGFMSGGEMDCVMALGIQKKHGDTYVRMPGQQYGTCLASSLLAINGGTEREEACRQFLEYAVSCEFQSNDSLNGTPISREAYFAKQQVGRYHCSLGVVTDMGMSESYDIAYPDAEGYERLTGLLDGVTGVNLCDTVVYETVVEYGGEALLGEIGIPEAVDAIEKRVKIYLAE